MYHTIPRAACRVAGRMAPHLARLGLMLVIFAGLGLVIGCGRSRGPVVQFVEGKVVLDGDFAPYHLDTCTSRAVGI